MRPVVTAVILGALALLLPRTAGATPGDLDPGFGAGGRVTAPVAATALLVQPGGKVLAAGEHGAHGAPNVAIVRFGADGTPDPSFGAGGLLDAGTGRVFALADDGKIVTAGYRLVIGEGSPRFLDVARFDVDGHPDATFGTGGLAEIDLLATAGISLLPHAIVVQPDGAVVVGGSYYFGGGYALVRLTSAGALDGSFASGGVLAASGPSWFFRALVLEPDGHLIVSVADPDPALVRYDASGAPDLSFGVALDDVAAAGALVRQPDGRLVVGGSAGSGPALARYDGGALDATFGSGGVARIPFPGGGTFGSVHAVLVEPAGTLVAAGIVALGPSPSLLDMLSLFVARLRADGTLDTSFGAGGTVLVQVDDYASLGDGVVSLARFPDAALAVSRIFEFDEAPVVRLLGGACGNGVLEGGEDCDDGNLVANDGCDASCCVADADGDGRCDAIDACPQGAAIERGSIEVTRLIGRPDNAVRLAGNLPLTSPFVPPLDLTATGARLAIANAQGQVLLDVAVSGGTYTRTTRVGWTERTNDGHPRWKWVDRRKVFGTNRAGGRLPGGIIAVTVQDKSRPDGGFIKITAKAIGHVAPLLANLPLTATAVLAPPIATAGQCGEWHFPGPPPAPSCALAVSGADLFCR